MTANQKPITLLSVADVAESYGIRPRALERLRNLGLGPTYFKLGAEDRCRIIYAHADIEDWIARHTIVPK